MACAGEARLAFGSLVSDKQDSRREHALPLRSAVSYTLPAAMAPFWSAGLSFFFLSLILFSFFFLPFPPLNSLSFPLSHFLGESLKTFKFMG